MKLHSPFIQLPVSADADTLLSEISAISEASWQPHPQGYAGNWGLPLLAANGDPDDNRTQGPMLPTPALERCPYLMHVMASIGAVWGRSRLMRLDGNSEVATHVDINYYWRERVRVHVPVLTNPEVRFECGDAHVNMAAGECWIFDTWRPHHVINPTQSRRIHLVADTVGSDAFWRLVGAGRSHDRPRNGWAPSPIPLASARTERLALERFNHPVVMSPWELKDALGFVVSEAAPHPLLVNAQVLVGNFFRLWRALWACHGTEPAGWASYAAAIGEFRQSLQPIAGHIFLTNGVEFCEAISSFVLAPALCEAALLPLRAPRSQQPAAVSVPSRTLVAPLARGSQSRDPMFDRPIFVVCPPRSGSTLLFETLSKASGLYTIGGENYEVLEGIDALHPRNRSFESNQLGISDATDEVIEQLRQRHFHALRDRDGARPTTMPIRMLEKTPKNALRIPFLLQVFPEAHFVLLHREPRQVISSMLEAWESGSFRTYPGLPDWPGLPWSMLLVPGWRELRGMPLRDIVAAQWTRTITALVTEIEALPREQWSVIRYDKLVQNPQHVLLETCTRHDLVWDITLPRDLPFSRNTVSAPHNFKWHERERDIAAIWPQIRDAADRLERLVLGVQSSRIDPSR